MLLTPDTRKADKAKPPKPVKPKASREQLNAMKGDVRKCEDRVNKINDMADKLSKKLADPALYEDARVGELETWNRKYAEIREALKKAESLWMIALERLDAADKP
jgi:ATP-binding cassette subfamily F protein 3